MHVDGFSQLCLYQPISQYLETDTVQNHELCMPYGIIIIIILACTLLISFDLRRQKATKNPTPHTVDQNHQKINEGYPALRLSK